MVTKLYSQLMGIAAPMNKFEELKATIDYMEQLLRQLEAQGETVNAKRMLAQQLMAKFPVGFLTKLEEQRNKPCEPWSTSDLRAAMKKYLDVHATARIMADFQHEHRHNQPSSHHPRQHVSPSASSVQVLAAHKAYHNVLVSLCPAAIAEGHTGMMNVIAIQQWTAERPAWLKRRDASAASA